MTAERSEGGGRAVWYVLVVAGACCLLPLLAVTGALGAVARRAETPAGLAVTGVLLAGGLWWVRRRRRSRLRDAA